MKAGDYDSAGWMDHTGRWPRDYLIEQDDAGQFRLVAYVLDHAAIQANTQICAIEGHLLLAEHSENRWHVPEPFTLRCGRVCDHGGWLLAPIGGVLVPPAVHDPAARFTTLSRARREMDRLECAAQGHDLDVTCQGFDPVTVTCARRCGHPGWDVKPIRRPAHG